MTIHYRDDKIICDEDGVTIQTYHFPLGTSKRIYYDEIEAIEHYRLRVHTGRYRWWGGDFKHWFNLDWQRHRKSTGIVLRLRGKWVVPILTPDEPDRVLQVLQEKTGLDAAENEEFGAST